MSRQKSMAEKLISLVLVVIFAFFVFPITEASACTEETQSKISYNKKLYDQNSKVCEIISKGMANREEQIYIGDFKLTREEAKYLVKTVIRKHPELYYVDATRYLAGTDGTYVMVVCPCYLYDEKTCDEMQKNFDKKVDEYLSKVDDSMTDFQKATVLHDELVINCRYTESNDVKYITAYDAIVENVANCQGYSEAYAYLLSLVGIESEIVESSAMYHIWNKVCIDETYYNVDLTWDDPMPNKEGHVGHKFFLLSDEAICSGENEIAKHYGFDYAYFKSNNKKYDNYKYRYVNTKLCFVGNDCYYIDNVYNSENEKCLVKYDCVNDIAQAVEQFDYRWMSGATSCWRGGFMSLEEHDGLLYFNSDKEIYVYDIDTHQTKLYSDKDLFNGNCYGMRIIDNEVYALVGDNPNVEGELKLVGECVDVEKTNVIVGDIDSDGYVSIVDVTYIQKYTAGLTKLTAEQITLADYNGDGNISIVDATTMQKTIVGL